MIDWAEKRATITAKLADKGTPATITRPGGGYDKRTDKRTTGAGTVTPCFAILSTETTSDDQGRLITYDVLTLTEESHVGDTITVGTTTYTVSKAITIAPGGVPIMFSAIVNT